MLLWRGAAPPLPVIGSTPDDTLLAVLDPLLAPSDTGAVADGRIPSLGRQMRPRRLQRSLARSAQNKPHVCRANPEPVFGPRRLTRKGHHVDRVLGRILGPILGQRRYTTGEGPLGGQSSQDDAPDVSPREMANRTGKASGPCCSLQSAPMAGAFFTRYDALS